MSAQDAVLVQLIRPMDHIPAPPPPKPRPRGHPLVYPERLFLKALVIVIVRHLHSVTELLGVLGQPSPEMRSLRLVPTEGGKFPSRRTQERRLSRRCPVPCPPR